MDVGTEWLIDAFGCRSDRLADVDFLHGVCDEIIAALDLHVVGQAQWRQFPPPGGITALCLLTESHLSLHTYPEKGVATINLYCCRPRPAWDWERTPPRTAGGPAGLGPRGSPRRHGDRRPAPADEYQEAGR